MITFILFFQGVLVSADLWPKPYRVRWYLIFIIIIIISLSMYLTGLSLEIYICILEAISCFDHILSTPTVDDLLFRSYVGTYIRDHQLFETCSGVILPRNGQ
jgi:hypothetical protein